MERITVTVINWDKYNPRKDFKTPVWFALSNRILEDPDLYDLDPLEFKAFIYILCQVSQRKGESTTLRFSHADRVSNLRGKDLKRAIDKLVGLGIIAIENSMTHEESEICTEGNDDLYRGSKPSVRHTTRQDITNKTLQDTSDFLERVYQKYPRREGKAKGMKRLKARKHDQATLELFEKAVDGYLWKTTLEKTAIQYIKLWSTFVGVDDEEPWRDFIDWTPQTGPTETKEERIARLIKEREGVAS